MVDWVYWITSFQGEVLKFHYMVSFKRLCRADMYRNLPELEADNPRDRYGSGTRTGRLTCGKCREVQHSALISPRSSSVGSIKSKSCGASDARATKITEL
jgi:hypothetical protein